MLKFDSINSVLLWKNKNKNANFCKTKYGKCLVNLIILINIDIDVNIVILDIKITSDYKRVFIENYLIYPRDWR